MDREITRELNDIKRRLLALEGRFQPSDPTEPPARRWRGEPAVMTVIVEHGEVVQVRGVPADLEVHVLDYDVNNASPEDMHVDDKGREFCWCIWNMQPGHNYKRYKFFRAAVREAKRARYPVHDVDQFYQDDVEVEE